MIPTTIQWSPFDKVLENGARRIGNLPAGFPLTREPEVFDLERAGRPRIIVVVPHRGDESVEWWNCP
jgi:hypothetical protein